MAPAIFKWALLAALLGVAVPAFLYKDRTKAAIDGAHESVSQLGIYAYPLWVVVHAFFIVVCFPGTFAFESAAGLLFGVVKGSAAVLVAKTLGAAIAFWLGKDGWWFVFLARLSPIPSWINNYGLAAVDVRFFPDYIVASCAGTVPFILLNTYFGYLAEQGLSATDLNSSRAIAQYALPGLGFLAAFALFWKLTSYAKHYQETLETPPQKHEVEDTASEVVFLNGDRSVGPAGGLRSRTKTGEEVTFSEDLGLVASPVKRNRAKKAGEREEVSAVLVTPEVEEEGEVRLEKVVLKEPEAEAQIVSPRRRGRPRLNGASPAPAKTPSRTTSSPMTSPSKRRPLRPRKTESAEL